MGKKIKFKEARRRAADADLAALLRAHRRDRDGGVPCYADFEGKRRASIEKYRFLAIRSPEDWRSRLKSHDHDKRFRELVRFVFARYRVARHLENAWLDEPAPGEAFDFRRWYILIADGGSLHRQITSAFLSKLETHHFLDAPDAVATCRQAFWYAFAMAESADAAVALNVARTKLPDYRPRETFWKEAARYFARNPLPIEEMNAFIDYFQAVRAENAAFTLKGRPVDALRRRVEEWRRMVERRERISGGTWAGLALEDVAYEAIDEGKRAIWSFRQIKTGNDLFKEGERMRHCVAGYKAACMAGHSSIWSLSCEFPIGHVYRSVTMEIREGQIVQCRGFANRQPHANEADIVRQWADEHGLAWHG
jgi:hypothetical protein